jgi:hypothetical protein
MGWGKGRLLQSAFWNRLSICSPWYFPNNAARPISGSFNKFGGHQGVEHVLHSDTVMLG